MKSARRFEGLGVWQQARQVSIAVYQVTSETIFLDRSLKEQMRRCAVSIMANVAEGFSRKSDKEFRQFLFVAKGSAAELQSHFYVALDQKYITPRDFQRLYGCVEYIARMLSNLIKYFAGTPSNLSTLGLNKTQ